MISLNSIIKPNLRSRLNTSGIPNFLSELDQNNKKQAHIWNNKTYQVNPATHIFTTIQEHFGNRLISSLHIPQNGVVVDIGCFIGEKLWQINTESKYLGVGVDIAVSSLKAAQKIDIYDHKFIAADMENLPFKNNSVDLVMVFDVIEHLSNVDKGFSEIYRVLKPGGRLLLHTPLKDNHFSLFWWKQKLFPKSAAKDYADVGHTSEQMPTQTQISSLLKKYNLTVTKKIHYNAFLVHFFDREMFKLLAFILSKLQSSSTQPTPKQKNGIKQNHLRDLYGRYIIPLLEVFSLPDLILTKLGIGNTCFYLVQKNLTDHTLYYQKNNSYSEFLTHGQLANFGLYISEILSRTPVNGKFLDTGCGTGIVVDAICKQGIQGYGAEVSETSLKLAKKKRGVYSLYTGAKLPYKNNYFDSVGSYTVLEHVNDVSNFLSESLRVLKPGGYLIICAPNFLSVTSSYHYRMAGALRKTANVILTFKKAVQYLLGVPVVFESFPPLYRQPFHADDDAVNLINPLDILRWGKENNVHLEKSHGAIMSNYLSYTLRNVPLVKLITGGVFVVFKKL